MRLLGLAVRSEPRLLVAPIALLLLSLRRPRRGALGCLRLESCRGLQLVLAVPAYRLADEERELWRQLCAALEDDGKRVHQIVECTNDWRPRETSPGKTWLVSWRS